ncbi:MAG: UvrD-helicase domain-containing protein [Candidatus Falkowbacteria bacterium]
MENLFKNLNEEQKMAVTHNNGPLLIVAGAGTGKTRVLIERLSYLVENKLANADEVLLLTFTEKATGEMEDRALKILPYGYVDLWINTFHGFCERILREHALDIGLDPSFKILSQTEQWILIKKNLDKFNLDYYSPLGNPNKFIYEMVKHFSRLKDENIKPHEYLDYGENLKQDNDSMLSGSEEADELETKRINELANAYHVYNKILLDNGYLDFGDLINYTIKLFRERPNILSFYQNKFKYIMVDEFQDTNWAQYELLKILACLPDKQAKKNNNLLVVGDDDQAVYKFRGASISNIMQFKDDYPDAQEIVLNKNYRSGQNILDSAYNFIQHNNPNRLEEKLKINKKLESKISDDGKVDYFNFKDEQSETSWVADKILEIYKENKDAKWSDFAVLMRANSTADKFIEEFSRKNIPNLFMSMRGLYYKPVVLDCIAYLRLLDNYHESSAIFRALNMEVFKVAHSDIININKFARRKAWSLFEALKNINAISGISAETIVNVNKFLNLINKHSVLAQKEKPSKIFINFIYDSEILINKDYDKDGEFFSYLNQFYQKIKRFEENEKDARLKDFMELLDLEMEAGETGSLKLDFEDDDTVKIMTAHGAKGLEFDYVFLVNLVDKRFPSIGKKEKISIPDKMVREKLPVGKDIHLEEERRLFYVAITRAKKNLFLTNAKDYGGAREKKPSVFIHEAGIPLTPDPYPASANSADRRSSQDMGVNSELVKDLENLKNPVDKKVSKFVLPNQFSFSQIEAFSNCPLQYKFNFILKIPISSKANFVFGRVMHNTLKDFLYTLLDSAWNQESLFKENDNKNWRTHRFAPTSFNDLVNAYKKNWIDDGYENKEERDKFKNKGKNIIKIFYNNLEKERMPKVLFLEKVFLIKIGGYGFCGAIDRVDKLEDGTFEIIDYKTGNPKEKLDWKGKRQLILYKIAMEEGLGQKVSKLSFYYLENGEKISFKAKDTEVEKLKLNILDAIKEMQKCEFIPKPSILCDYCDFKGICEFRKT